MNWHWVYDYYFVDLDLFKETKPFDKYDFLKIRDLERCPYVFGTKACGEWSREDDKRMLLIALDRYADYLQGRE